MQGADNKTEKGANALADLFSAGMEGSEAFGNALRNLAAEPLKSQVLKLLLSFGKSGAPGSGIIGAIGGALGGTEFASGGYTGDGGKFEPAGVVHRGEFVFSKETVQGAGRRDAGAAMDSCNLDTPACNSATLCFVDSKSTRV